MARYCLTILLGAFLLFQIQPILARLLLPSFGGSSAVWTTCMMFFQCVLCLGYAYAHGLRALFRPKTAFQLHCLLLVVAMAAFFGFRPTTDTAAEIALDTQSLNLSIILVLSTWIGLPFLLLATTGPLVQTWSASTHAGQSPYRLYALSNAGSMAALLTYPFLIEPYFRLDTQLLIWAIGFGVYVLATYWSLVQTWSLKTWTEGDADKEPQPDVEETQPFRLTTVIFWLVLSATSSLMFLATTNLLCQEVASVPFLWIAPLAIYLLSFIVCFDRPQWYRRNLWICLAAIGSISSILLLHLDVHAGFLLQLIGLSMTCLSVCMVCHGELEQSKPCRSRLTFFYLMISVGSALGGIFVTLIAPEIFSGFYELHLGLLVALLISGVQLVSASNSQENDLPQKVALLDKGMLKSLSRTATGLLLFASLGIVGCSLYYYLEPANHPGLVYRGRNAYGLTSVEENDEVRNFINGRVIHGVQWLDADMRLKPSAYYVEGSGIAAAFESMRDLRQRPLHVGVLGLGAGAMSAWLEQDDRIQFYEINPMVVDVAKQYFDFLKESPGEKSILVGDGRVLLTKQLRENGSKNFDLLVMDAFSSDSVPVHLLTEECFRIYDQHLAKDGILVVHISNRFVDLLPVILHHQKTVDMKAVFVDFQSEDGKQESRWVLLTRNPLVLNHPVIESASQPIPDIPTVRWTDDFSSIASRLRWSTTIDLDQAEGSSVD